MPALGRLARQAPQHLKCGTYFCANPKPASGDAIHPGNITVVFSSNPSERGTEQSFLSMNRLGILSAFEEKLGGVYVYEGKVFLIRRRKGTNPSMLNALFDNIILLATIVLDHRRFLTISNHSQMDDKAGAGPAAGGRVGVVGTVRQQAGAGCNAAGKVIPERAFEGTMVAVGDSLTAGLEVPEEKAYPAVLARKLKAAGYAYRVANAGVSGETSSGTRSPIGWIVSFLDPDTVILETGANAFGVISRRPHWPGQNHRTLRAVGR
jgi:hypothetical protein